MVVVAASTALAAVALAERSQSHAGVFATTYVHHSPLSRFRALGPVRLVRGTAIERSVASRAVRDLGPANRVLRIEFTSPPGEFGLPSSARWVTVDVAAPDRPGAAFSIWQGFLAVSAISDAIRAEGAASIAGKTIRLVFPTGTTTDAGSTVNGPPPASDTGPASAEALEALTRAAAHQEGLHVVEQGSFDVGGRPAVFATVITDDPLGFAKASGAKLFSLQRGVYDAPSAAAGSFVEVRDPKGGVVESGGTASRLQQGVGWTNPALRSLDEAIAH